LATICLPAPSRLQLRQFQIVFVIGANPVALGLVASFNRPGGNITGVTTVIVDIWQKRLQLPHDLVPNARRFGYLVNPDDRGGDFQNVENTVRRWGCTLEVASSRAAPDFDAAFAEFAERHVEAVVIGGDALFASEPVRLSRLAAQYAVPVIYASAASVRYGGLMSYSADIRDAFRQAGLYAGRILKDEKPADLPVQLPTKFEMAVSARAAEALGLTIPESLLATADKLIE
jgi:putative tryptophan/tyrosine transport system substrate-binding protein